MNTCTNDTTELFLAGQLTEVETAAFEDHLETCDACRERLEQAAGGAELWQSARELLVYQLPTAAGGAEVGDLTVDRPMDEAEWLPSCTNAAVLSILSATDDPDYVGRIGSYEISGVVGRGSAGIVLRGFDRSLHRNVAIKILDPAIAGVGAARQRFAREARAMAAISHEHVVPVYEVNEHAGLPFFVMEYVPGGSLERRLHKHGAFDVESVVRIGLQIADALAVAHAQGLVHRDIKPGNILLDRGTDRVRVADFGLVRVSNDVSCTRSGFIAGTPQYMAPEQVKAEICDGRSDLFSLGSLMYALCTGHAPFRADTVYGVMQRIVHDAPRPIRQSNPQIPDWLDEFILRLMSKDRVDRFARASDVVQILRAELAYLQNPASGQTPSRSRRLRRWLQPRRLPRFMVLRGGAIMTLVMLIGAINVYPWIARGGKLQQQVPEINTPLPTPSEPGNRQSVVSWNADGTATTQAAVIQLDQEFHRPTEYLEQDPWNVEMDELRRRMGVISTELEGAIPRTLPPVVPRH